MEITLRARALVTLLATTLLVFAPAQLFAEPRDGFKAFIERNPIEKFTVFRGRNIGVLYTCYGNMRLGDFGVCDAIEDITRQYRSILFYRIGLDRHAITFAVTKATLVDSYVRYNYSGCQMSKQRLYTAVNVPPRPNVTDLERCVAISALHHLGFDVEPLVSDDKAIVDLDKILDYYTNYL